MSRSSAPGKNLKAKRLVPGLLSLGIALICGASFNVAFADDASLNNNLMKLEDKYFQHDFSKDEISDRIDRLEKLVYGETRSGNSEDRVKMLLSLVPNLDAKPDDAASQA